MRKKRGGMTFVVWIAGCFACLGLLGLIYGIFPARKKGNKRWYILSIASLLVLIFSMAYITASLIVLYAIK